MARKINTSKTVIIGLIIAAIAFFGIQSLLLNETEEHIAQDEVEEMADETSVIEEGAARTGAETETAYGEDNATFPNISQFSEYVINNDPEETGFLGGEFTENAFDHLTDALEELAEQQEIALDEQTIGSIEEQVTRYKEGEDAEKASLLKSAFLTTHSVLRATSLAEQEEVQSHLDALENAANALDDAAPLEQQDEQIDQFFNKAVLVLEAMEEHV